LKSKHGALICHIKSSKTSDRFLEGNTANTEVGDRVADVLGAVVLRLVESDAVIASSEQVETCADEPVPNVFYRKGILKVFGLVYYYIGLEGIFCSRAKFPGVGEHGGRCGMAETTVLNWLANTYTHTRTHTYTHIHGQTHALAHIHTG
jgi:hypothetical protein